MKRASSILLFLLGCGEQGVPVRSHEYAGSTVDFDVVYVRYARRGDEESVELPDGENPYAIEAGADLVLLHPDGSEEILVDCRDFTEDPGGGDVGCSVQDPVVSYDARWVVYAKYTGLEADVAWRDQGADSFLYKMRLDLPAGERLEVQLTAADERPATDKLAGNGEADRLAGFGIRDLGPAPLPDGRIAFTSNRETVMPFNQGVIGSVEEVEGSTCSQLHVIDDHDGTTPNRNIRNVGFSNLHQIQHPTVLADGRLLFTNWDDAGLRESYGIATLYTSGPDGTHLAQFLEPHNYHKKVDHFVAELGGGSVVVVNYYPFMAMWGFGQLERYPVETDGPDFVAGFQEEEGDYRFFSRIGLDQITPHTDGEDYAAPDASGRYTTPSAAPDDGMLVAYSPGPVIRQGLGPDPDTRNRPRLDSGVYLFANAGTESIEDPAELVLLKNDPAYNEMWPRAVVPYERIHGVAAPAEAPAESPYGPTPRDRGWVGGSAMALVGTSSMQNRESAPYGNDYFNSGHGKLGISAGWAVQGTDAGRVGNEDLWGVRILVVTPDRYHAPWDYSATERDEYLMPDNRAGRHVRGYHTHSAENWKILGEVPTRNPEGMPDPSGEEDTSWLAWVPAHTPFLVQGIDRRGMTLFTEQTWRHVNAGETVADCGGCHAHSIPGVEFTGKAADAADYDPFDLVRAPTVVEIASDGTPGVIAREGGLLGVEFRRDVLPILERECRECHASSGDAAPAAGARLAMFDDAMSPGFEADVRVFQAIAQDSEVEFAHGPAKTIPAGDTSYRGPQMSRYVRALQARASLLVWKVWGERLDGRTNADLPEGGDIATEDLDYEAGTCPAPDRLDTAEKVLLARWIDLGCAIDLDRPRMTYTDDHLLPVLHLEAVETDAGTVRVRAGVLDLDSGIDEASLSIEVTEPGSDLSRVYALADVDWNAGAGVATIELDVVAADLTYEEPLRVAAEVADLAGNREWAERWVGEPLPDLGGDADADGDADVASKDDGGCGCRTPQSGGTSWGATLALAVAAFLRRVGARRR